MRTNGLRLGLAFAATLVVAGTSSAASTARFCYPGFTISAVHVPALTIPAWTSPAVTIPSVTIPAVTIPAACFAGTCYPEKRYPAKHYPAKHYPAKHYPARHYPARTIPARTIPGRCFDTSRYSAAFAPASTTVRTRNYDDIDRTFSPQLSTQYWRQAGSTVSFPNTYATGFGRLNAAGFPKNQYVRPYVRRNGTVVAGYWRNSPSDGLPTCRIIRC